MHGRNAREGGYRRKHNSAIYEFHIPRTFRLHILYFYIIHFYSSELVGTVALLLAIVSLLNIFFSLGIGNGMQHYLSYYLGRNDYVTIRNIIMKFTLISISLATAGLLFIYFGSSIFAILFFHTFKYMTLIKLLGIDFFFTLLSGLFGQMLWGVQKFKFQAEWNITGVIVSYSLPVIFLHAFRDANLIVIGWATGNAISSVAFLIMLISIARRGGRGETFHSIHVIKYSVPIFMASLIGYGATYVDRFIVSYLMNLSLLCLLYTSDAADE